MDDMLFFGDGNDVIYDLKSLLLVQFDTKDLGPRKHMLGMEIKRDKQLKDFG